MIRERAPAKLNLALHILGRRPDSYHALESLVVFTEFADLLEVSPAETLRLEVAGEFAAEAGAGENNLVLKAAQILRANFAVTQGAVLRLTKHLPVGGGLGGGSADAAAALRALNQLWELHRPMNELAALALPLGADVPSCVWSKPAFARGIGEELAFLPEPLPPLHLLLVHPRTPVLTAEVYRRLAASPLLSPPQFDHAPATYTALLEWLGTTRNDLTPVAVEVNAQVTEILEALAETAPDFHRMTGSGACCFALYATPERAEQAGQRVSAAHPEWWVKATSAC